MNKWKRILAFLMAFAVMTAYTPSLNPNVSASAGSTGTVSAAKLVVKNVAKSKKTMYVGSSFALQTNQSSAAFASSKSSIVTVTSNGVLYAKKKGKATITVMSSTGATKKIKVTVKKATGYSISKKAGTYSSPTKVKITAKKGYKVYYSTTGKFSSKKVVKSGKSKTLKISKTTTVSLFAVKKSASISVKKMNSKKTRKKNAGYEQYLYEITDGADSDDAANNADSSSSSTTSASSSNATTQTTVDTTTEMAPSTTTENKVDSTLPEFPDLPDFPAPPTESASTTQSTTTQDNAQDIIDQTTTQASTQVSTQEPATTESTTPVVDLANASALSASDSSVVYTTGENYDTVTIKEAGTYVLTGGSSEEPVTNLAVEVASNIAGAVNLIWEDLYLDNSTLGSSEDVSSFSVQGAQSGETATSTVNITLSGENYISGCGTYESEANAVISATDTDTVITMNAADDSASLTVVDSMDSSTDFGDTDPADGIFAKGTLIINGGIIDVTSNGDCIKATGKKGNGGVTINGGTLTLQSNLSNAIKSKNGNITITGGSISSTYTKEDSINAKNYGVIISGGTINIDQCYGDGIQGETVAISGDSTSIDITTYFENAGINYYNSALGTGNYNTMTTGTTTKKETVNVDTGSHKGIKAGTKASSYSYTTVEDGSDNEAGEIYTQEASGGLTISGGTIHIDTTNTGIKYNGQGGSGNFTAANSDGQIIIGSPDDTIHSNNTCTISGGTLTLASSDDGITCPGDLLFINGCDITVTTAYEGIESGNIIIGSSTSSDASPNIKVYTLDDGINASSKSSITYVYTDESEEQYTKTEVSSSNNTLTILDGYVNVMIGDDVTHSFSLPVENGENTTGTCSADGDGIDANGSFYAKGGTIIVYGATSNDNSPIDTDNDYTIEAGVTLLAVGSSGMIANPTSIGQAAISYGSSSGGMGGMGGFGQSGSSLSANTAFAILDGSSNTLLSIKPIKSYSYVLYTSPALTSGSTYTVYSNGSVSGNLINSDTTAHDYRYEGYSSTSATSLGSATISSTTSITTVGSTSSGFPF